MRKIREPKFGEPIEYEPGKVMLKVRTGLHRDGDPDGSEYAVIVPVPRYVDDATISEVAAFAHNGLSMALRRAFGMCVDLPLGPEAIVAELRRVSALPDEDLSAIFED